MADAESATLMPQLVLAPHAKLGRRISISFALIFLFGFNGALVVASMLNWKSPCDQPLKHFLLGFGFVGIVGSICYFVLEVIVNRKNARDFESGKAEKQFVSMPNVLVGLILLAATISGFMGVVYYKRSVQCNLSAPILYQWSFAAILAFLIFIGLIILVPVLTVVLPLLGKLLALLVGILSAIAGICDQAGKKKDGKEGEYDEAATSKFALYVNTTALAWFFVYFLVEVYQNYDLPCDQPLHLFVMVFAIFGLTLTLLDFIYDVFKDNTPPMTRPEQEAARKGRQKRILLYSLILLALIVWGAIGMDWLKKTQTCQNTASQIYKMSLLLVMAFMVLCALLALLFLLIGLDFCCSGRMRFVVVFEERE